METIKRLRGFFFSPLIARLNRFDSSLSEVKQQLEFLQQGMGRIENRQLSASHSCRLEDHEFRVFSQGGEDGIIQFLLRHVLVESRTFVEFGVENYRESNTRFLLENNKWRGLIVDRDSDNIDQVKKSHLSWKHDLTAVSAFITRDNINELIRRNGFTGEMGLLSIDLDGNDYWVWKAIDVISPVIVIVEYNYRFGRELAVTIPYDEAFERAGAHSSKIYFGASLRALELLAKQKGYVFVGCSSDGVNAFFVRADKLPPKIKALTVAEGYVQGHVSETFDNQGRFECPSQEDSMRLLLSLPLVHVENHSND